jgi:hypothetical protein
VPSNLKHALRQTSYLTQKKKITTKETLDHHSPHHHRRHKLSLGLGLPHKEMLISKIHTHGAEKRQI